MKKIVVIGPESTGKTTLCTQLAEHYNTVWCPEYAREYLTRHGRQAYDYEDLLDIARGQLKLEHEMIAEARNGHYFIDTDMYVMKVWCEIAFENCHSWILKQIVSHRYDLYLLCRTDLDWVKDDLREYPDPAIRNRLFKMYKDIVINSGVPWAEVYGKGPGRLETAIEAVETSLRR